jgi:hypothetical protein
MQLWAMPYQHNSTSDQLLANKQSCSQGEENDMARKKLAKISGTRKAFQGIFVRYGKKPAWNSPQPLKTLLLKDIRDVATGELVTDHLWFNLTKGFEAIQPLSGGTVIQFDARVKPYEKGFVNWRQSIDERVTDYKLSHPTKIKKVTQRDLPTAAT